MIVDAVDDFITRETYNVRRGKCKHGAQRRRCHSVRGVLYMMHGVIEGNVIVTLGVRGYLCSAAGKWHMF
jgi:hypothetical protein